MTTTKPAVADRARRALELYGAGWRQSSIAKELGVQVRTVERYIARCRSQIQAADDAAMQDVLLRVAARFERNRQRLDKALDEAFESTDSNRLFAISKLLDSSIRQAESEVRCMMSLGAWKPLSRTDEDGRPAVLSTLTFVQVQQLAIAAARTPAEAEAIALVQGAPENGR